MSDKKKKAKKPSRQIHGDHAYKYPEFSKEQLEYLEVTFTPIFSPDDSDETLRWKAAQLTLVNQIIDFQLQLEQDRTKLVVQGVHSPLRGKDAD